jgi:hypothetical protein
VKLIRHHHRRSGLGLTLPFIVGAVQKPVGLSFVDESAAYVAFRKLLSHMEQEVSESDFVHIFKCPKLGQPVATVTPTYYHPNHASWGVSPPPRLLISDPYRSDRPQDIDRTSQLLWAVVSAPIAEARFGYSHETRAYVPFDDADRQFIADALAYDEDNQL